jgi:hypothetical protein
VKDWVPGNWFVKLILDGHWHHLSWWHNILPDWGGFLWPVASLFSLLEISPLLKEVVKFNVDHFQLRVSEAVCFSVNQAFNCI